MLTYCSSDYEICSTILSGGANNEDHGDGGEAMVIKCSGLEKKKEKNKMGSRQRFGDQDT